MNVSPHATAKGRNQSGTMNGKLNGVIAGEDADRLADHVGVDPARDVLEVRALHERGDAGRDLDALDAAAHLAARRP